MTRICVEIPNELHGRVVAVAKATNRTTGQFFRDAVELLVDLNELDQQFAEGVEG